MRNIFAGLVMLVAISASGQWSEQVSGVTTILHSVSAVNNDIVWICGNAGIILRTTNGGSNWLITDSPNPALTFYNICGIDANTALVTGSDADTYVYKTTNGGAEWMEVFTQSGGFINAIVKFNSASGECAMTGDPVGGRWSIWYSGDNGSTWDSSGHYLSRSGSETGFVNSAFGIGIYNSNYFWFGTSNTRIYRGRGGSNWVVQPSAGDGNTYTINFTDSLNGYSGGYSSLRQTSNGGTNWMFMHLTANVMGIVKGINTGELFYAESNFINHTSDNGANWAIVHSAPTGEYYHMVKARTGNNIWAVTYTGQISKYTSTVSINPIFTEIPSEYSLSQNYPNPFNPSTTIKFAIPKPSVVKLAVYDITGKELEVLVNEPLPVGTYQSNWNGLRFSSGIYFYRLVTEAYSDTKRMLFIK
jgi:hypothetical protein